VSKMPNSKVVIINRGKFMDEDGADEAHWRHTHVVSAKGLEMLDHWFPDMARRLDLAGAPRLRWGTKDVRITFPDGLLTQEHDLGIETRSMSRGLLERELYYQVAAHPRIELVEEVEVIALVRKGDLITAVDVMQKSAQPL